MPWANRFQNYEAHLITPGQDGRRRASVGSAVRFSWTASTTGSPGPPPGTSPTSPTCTRRRSIPRSRCNTSTRAPGGTSRVEQATFRVKGPKGMETVTLPLYYTHHGPVVKFDKEKHRAWSVQPAQLRRRELHARPVRHHEGAQPRGVQSRRGEAIDAALEPALLGLDGHLLGAQRQRRPARPKISTG